MRLLICVSQPAGNLISLYIFSSICKTERNNFIIPELFFHLIKINAVLINSGRSSSLKPAHFNSKILQRLCQIIGCLKTVRPSLIAHISVNTPGFQVSTGCEDHCFRMINGTRVSFYSRDFAVLCQNLCHFSLPDRKIFCISHCLCHSHGIHLFIRLCPEGMNSWSLGTVQHFGLNISLIYIHTHFTAKSIDLFYQMSLGASSYIRITRHQGYAVHAHCKTNCFKSKAR